MSKQIKKNKKSKTQKPSTNIPISKEDRGKLVEKIRKELSGFLDYTSFP